MAGKLSRSWSLTKQSWSILAEDKRLLIFPVVSGTLTVLICASFIVPAVVLGMHDKVPAGDEHEKQTLVQQLGIIGLLGMFACYFVVNFVTVYFNVALMACVFKRFDGQAAGPMDGIQFANTRLGKIAGWAAINATVGTVIQALKERADFLGRLVLGGAGLAWQIATFFVVPVMIVENVGPIEAVKRSTSVLKKTWGESLVTQMGVSFVLFLFALAIGGLIILPSIVLGIALHVWIIPVLGLTIGIVAWLALIAVGSAMKTVLVAACYRFAQTGECPGIFEAEAVEGAFSVKG